MFTNLFIAKLIISVILWFFLVRLFLRLYKHLTNFFKDLINFLKRPSRIKKSRYTYFHNLSDYRLFYPTPLHKRVDVLQRNKDFTFLRGKTRPGFLSNEDISNPIYFRTGSISVTGATLIITDTTGPSNEPHYVLGQPSVHYSIPIR